MKTITINETEFPVFCTVDEAEEYFASKYNSSTWDNLTTEEKQKVLVEATRKLNNLKYRGFPVCLKQPLAFPRYFKPNFLSKRTYLAEANAITVYGRELIYIEDPIELRNACCEEAVNIVLQNASNNTVHLQNQKMGIASVSIMGDSVSYTGNGGTYTGSATDSVCKEAIEYISKYLTSTARVV